MTPDYQRGFDEGFATALSRMDRRHIGAPLSQDFNGGKKISIGFRPDQFVFITKLSVALDCSFGAAVRHLIDQNIKSREAR